MHVPKLESDVISYPIGMTRIIFICDFYPLFHVKLLELRFMNHDALVDDCLIDLFVLVGMTCDLYMAFGCLVL